MLDFCDIHQNMNDVVDLLRKWVESQSKAQIGESLCYGHTKWWEFARRR